MRKLTVIFIVILIILFTAGCSNIVTHHYIFTGESESWTVELMVDSTEFSYEEDGQIHKDNNEWTKFTITYKGELSDLSSVRLFNVSYETPDGEASWSKYYDNSHINKKTFTDSSGSGGNVELIQEDTVINLTVNIDGKTETMDLKANS